MAKHSFKYKHSDDFYLSKALDYNARLEEYNIKAEEWNRSHPKAKQKKLISLEEEKFDIYNSEGTAEGQRRAARELDKFKAQYNSARVDKFNWEIKHKKRTGTPTDLIFNELFHGIDTNTAKSLFSALQETRNLIKEEMSMTKDKKRLAELQDILKESEGYTYRDIRDKDQFESTHDFVDIFEKTIDYMSEHTASLSGGATGGGFSDPKAKGKWISNYWMNSD